MFEGKSMEDITNHMNHRLSGGVTAELNKVLQTLQEQVCAKESVHIIVSCMNYYWFAHSIFWFHTKATSEAIEALESRKKILQRMAAREAKIEAIEAKMAAIEAKIAAKLEEMKANEAVEPSMTQVEANLVPVEAAKLDGAADK